MSVGAGSRVQQEQPTLTVFLSQDRASQAGLQRKRLHGSERHEQADAR